LDELYKGSSTAPPTEGPKAATGKSVWFISCGEQVSGCTAVSSAAKDAAAAMGWDFHIADGNLGIADGYTTATRTALASSPDAIIVHGWSCDDAQQALQEAKDQGVLVLGLDNTDCSDVAGGGPQLFTTDMVYTDEIPDNASRWKEYGRLAADYIINESGGTAKIINNPGTDTLALKVDEGFLDELKKCPGCEVVDTVKAADEDVAPGGAWIQGFRSSLIQHPDATAAYLPWDFLMSSTGGAQAIKESGLDITAFGGLGTQDGIDLVNQGQISAITGGRDASWTAWSAFDQLNRAFNNQPSVPQGQGWILIDKDHNFPADGASYATPVDYKAAYTKLWGAQQ
jgi:ribose transport system substrate-binding protein